MRAYFRFLGFAFAFCVSLSSADAPLPSELPDRTVKVAFAFKNDGECQMALTGDSVGVLAWDPAAGALEPDDENDGLENAVGKRALSASERDSAAQLLDLMQTFKGVRRFECPRDDGYAFSLWSDSLTLHCRNCFSCTEGVSISEARKLARLGRLSLWLYRMRTGLDR